MIPLFPIDEVCLVCRKACLDKLGEHAVMIEGFKTSNTDMTLFGMSFFYVFNRVGFLTNPLEWRSTLRPSDVLVYDWVGGKHACADLTGVSPLVGLTTRDFAVGQAALKAASSKVAKHERVCSENQHVFIPFAFETFGFLASEALIF
ncbi:hypothetical protein QL285_031545 [Trifolium repens]|nr:hypothetical protein QL285_031545 [Trifolium repens]